MLLSAVPLLGPALPPLTDALGHLARYHIETAIGRSPALQVHYAFSWHLIGNLGVDLLIIPLTPVFGVELATKLVVLTIPVLTATGLILIAVQVHGRAPPFVAFALPLAYGYPLHFGFINYCLSVALALIAFAGWLALGKAQRLRLRGGLFVAVGLALWLCHVFGWALLVLLVVAAEWARLSGEGRSALSSARIALIAASPLAPPALLMLTWRSGDVGGDTGHWFDLPAKLGWLTATLRDRWEVFDRASAALLGFIAIAGGIDRNVGFARVLGVVAAAVFAAFLALPEVLLGSAYADMRLAPFALAIALIAIRTPPRRGFAQGLAIAGLIFFLVRTTATTFSFARYYRAYQEQLAAVPHIPRGARVIVFAGTACKSAWSGARMEHLGGLATVRRDAFVNDQWVLAGAQLLSVHHPDAGYFAQDPSQIVRPAYCHEPPEPVVDGLIPRFPTAAFNYVWLINLPGAAMLQRPGLIRVWSRGDGALYRIAPSAAGSPPPP